jgi:hypothetical protein
VDIVDAVFSMVTGEVEGQKMRFEIRSDYLAFFGVGLEDNSFDELLCLVYLLDGLTGSWSV